MTIRFEYLLTVKKYFLQVSVFWEIKSAQNSKLCLDLFNLLVKRNLSVGHSPIARHPAGAGKRKNCYNKNFIKKLSTPAKNA